MIQSVCRLLNSPRIAVLAMASLAASIAAGTVIDAWLGQEYAHWYVYDSSWFLALIGLVGSTLLVSGLLRFRASRNRVSFLAMHAGSATLLAGLAAAMLYGVHGEVTLYKGQPTDQMRIPGSDRIRIERSSARGRAVTEVSFQPGPCSWPEGRTLDMGTADGLGLTVLAFHPHARQTSEWVADNIDYSGPALRLLLSGRNGNAVAEEWLSGNAFGGEVIIGPTRYVLFPIPLETMLQDFMDPPADMGSAGVLSIHCDGRLERIRVDKVIGKVIQVGSAGTSVEIAAYLPNARPTPNGQFASAGELPKNPVLELTVQLPGAAQVVRQVAFAKLPLLTLDGVRGNELPVKFWYHHAAVKPVPGAEFVQTPSGSLFCRTAADGVCQPARQVHEQDRLPIGSDFHLTIDKHLPRARQEIRCLPVARHEEGFETSEAAVLIEVALGDQQQQLWLTRNDAQYGSRQLFVEDTAMEVSFGSQQLPLGCQLQLQEIHQKAGPAGSSDSDFISTAKVSRSDPSQLSPHEISIRQPLRCGKYRLFQKRCEKQPAHREVVVLAANYDPGRWLNYGGACLLCFGLFLMYRENPARRKSIAGPADARTEPVAHDTGEGARAKAA